jgi:hypothetical protein
MLIHLKTFDGHAINDGAAYKAALLSPRSKPNAKPVYLEQTESDAADAGTYTLDVQTRAIAIEIHNYGNRYALIAQLEKWFKPGLRADLVATFADDGVDYQMECRVINLVQDPENGLRFTAVLQSSTTDWRSVSPQTDTWTVTATGGTKSLTVGGNDATRLIASFTPAVAPGTGYTKQNIYQLVNTQTAINFGVTPWCITINTAALVTAGKMLASCYDLRVYDGDVEIKRWIADPNTSASHIWLNLNISAGYALKLKTAINNSQTVTTLDFTVDATHTAIITSMPSSGVIYHGTEWFAYSGKDAAACKLTITARGMWGTTKQAHNALDVFYWIQHPIRVLYGNPYATDPALDNSNYDVDKPIFNLSSSDNTKWVYDATTKFYDASAPSRTGQWSLKEVKLGDVSKVYHIKEDAPSGDPAMGVKSGIYQKGAVYLADTVELAFMLYAPGGLSKITATGRKYRNTVKWFIYAGCQYSLLLPNWTPLWTEATPTTTTWESWAAHSAIAIPNTAKWVRFPATGTILVQAGAYAMSEALTVTVEFYTTNLPTAAFLGEANGYPIDLILSNAAGESLRLNYPAQYNIDFLLDGENYIATYGTANAHRAIALNDAARVAWLPLSAGSNTLTIVSADVGTLNVALSWYRRRL